MCGIAGILSYHPVALPVDHAELIRMRDHMAARGPDGRGAWVTSDRRVGFAHRRLSIIDLSEGGAQPMISSDGMLAITFNGEIYNFRELRADLESRGYRFRSNSDTEVLLQLYADRGEAMLNDLRGMFAFAIWDGRKRATFLCRDPYGIKPLYYADDGWTFRFASQVKALLASEKISKAPEPAGIVGFYLFGSVPEPYTIYQEIRSLPAGSSIWVDSTGPSAPERYFSHASIWASAERYPAIDSNEASAIVREAMRDSVRHHVVADVPVAAFLSAGIDSGALVGLMSEIGDPSALSSLTLSFAEYRGRHDDEAPLAAKVASHYGAMHTVRSVSEKDFGNALSAILKAMDQPTIDGINTWFVSKAASEQGMKVAVSGLGGDELFGGYPSFKDIPRWMRMLWLPCRIPGLAAAAEQLQASFAPLFQGINPKAIGMLRHAGSPEGAYLLRRGIFLPHELPRFLDFDLVVEGLRRLRPLELIRQAFLEPGSKDAAPRDPYGIVALMEAGLYMRNQLLRDTDWASMAHSLEVRVPLVDGVLLKKLAGPLSAVRINNRKLLLADAPSRPLPRTILDRVKSGFTTPVDRWQENLPDLKWQTQDYLSSDNCPWARRWAWSVMHGDRP